MGATSIEWTGHTVNPLRARLRSDPSKVGHYCEKVSPGCTFCYSSRFQPRRHLPEFSGTHGRGLDLGEPFLDVSKLEEVLRRRKPTTYFWCDMTDMFGRWVSDEQIAACFGVMAATPWHTHQVLTKRAERLPEWFEWVAEKETALLTLPRSPQLVCALAAQAAIGRQWTVPDPKLWPLPNVWLGVSVEDQQRADERIPYLLGAPAAVRFLSCEPLLGPVDLTRLTLVKPDPPFGPGAWLDCLRGHIIGPDDMLDARIAWAICGGESGPGARPMHPEWARGLRDQCVGAGVPFFFKQWGHWSPFATEAHYTKGSLMPGCDEVIGGDCGGPLVITHTTKPPTVQMQDGSKRRCQIRSERGHRWGKGNLQEMTYCGVGKKAAGRLLDGREWNEMPEAPHA